MAGDWDLAVRPLDDNPKYLAVARHLCDGVSWMDTGIIAYVQQKLREVGRYDDCETDADVIRRYERLDVITAQIRKEGRLRRQFELGTALRGEHGGIMLHLDRNGALIKGIGGAHRLAIARALKLPQIPVQIGVVHPLAISSGFFRAIKKA